MMMQMLLGAAQPIGVDTPNVAAEEFRIDPDDSTVFLNFRSTGGIWRSLLHTNSNTPEQIGTWLLNGVASDYEIMLTGTGDTPNGPALDAWHSLGDDQGWDFAQTVVGSKIFNGTYYIRRATGVTQGDGTFRLACEVDM